MLDASNIVRKVSDTSRCHQNYDGYTFKVADGRHLLQKCANLWGFLRSSLGGMERKLANKGHDKWKLEADKGALEGTREKWAARESHQKRWAETSKRCRIHQDVIKIMTDTLLKSLKEATCTNNTHFCGVFSPHKRRQLARSRSRVAAQS